MAMSGGGSPDGASALRSVHTSNLPALFDQAGISVVVSTYQAGKVIVLRNDHGTLNTHFRTFAKPMGVAADRSRLTIGGTNTVWEYRNMPTVAEKLEPARTHDACYLPRRIHVTGDIDIHELAWDGSGELWVVNTRFCCLCTLDADHSFHPRWRPSFISALAPEDRCHLNGLAMVDGRPRYVTALGETDTAGGWRADKARGGILINVETGDILLRGLSMPHSPRWYQGRLWVLESGEGSLAVVDLARRTWRTVARMPGFTRGLDFVGPLAFVGLSQVRESAVFASIPLVERLTDRTCGVWVVHIETGETLGFLRFEAGVQEIFAVQVLRGIRFPEILEWTDDRLAHSYVLPDDAIADVVLPTEDDLARSPAFHFRRGNDLYGRGKLDEAIAAYGRCLALQPDHPDARYNCGVALGDARRYAEALACLEEVVRAEPERADAHNSLGYLVAMDGQPTQAIACWERAIKIRPSYAQAHVNLGMTLLQMGEYQRGFAELEWRQETGHGGREPTDARWDGRPVPGRTLVIHADQPTVDVIQLARYLPLAADRCGTLVVACSPDVAPVLQAVPGIAELRELGRVDSGSLDVHRSLLSLPHVFDTTLATVPRNIPYVDAASLRRGRNGPACLPSDRRPRVGIAWTGDAGTRGSAAAPRSIREWLPVLRTCAGTLYSLETGAPNRDLSDLAPEVEVHVPECEPANLGDVAALIGQLDLVIGVDAPAVHLAGAMGKPAWTLLGDRPGWRWLLEGETSPWYPTMRLFPSRRTGAWPEAMLAMVDAMKAWRWSERS